MDTNLSSEQKYIISRVVESYRAKLKGMALQEWSTLDGWQQACLAFGQPMNRNGMRKVIRKAKK